VADLSKIERLMLVHVCRYRMTMRRGWRGAWELRDYSAALLAQAVRRLVRLSLLRQSILHGSVHAFELTESGSELLGLPAERGRPLSPQATVRAYAQLLYATTGSMPLVLADRDVAVPYGRNRRAAGEIDDYSKVAWGRLVDPSGSGVCHMLFVDGSLQTSPNRVAQRVRRQILKLTDSSYWVEEIRQGKVGPSVITATNDRARRIMYRFNRYPQACVTSLAILVAPGMLPLLRRIENT
jgi:hypothetical protein